jgi:tetratricopeptide (TPR) repeat protein
MPHALSLADQAGKDSDFDKLEYAMVQMYRTKTNVFRATVAGSNAIRELESCLRVFEEMGSLSSVADALLEIGSLYVTESEEQKALNFLQRSIDLCEEMGNYRKQAEAYFWMGMAHFDEGRHQQALEVYTKIIEIGAKIGDYNRMAWARLYSSLLHESLWELEEGLEDSLEGVGYAEKTDSYYIQCAIYTSVARLSVKLGDSRYSTEYAEKFEKSFVVAGPMSSKTLKAGGVRTQAVLFAAKGQWDEANNHFEKCLELYQGALATTLHEAMARTDYAWALAKQGRIDDARIQIDEAKKLYGKLGNKSSIERLSIILSEFEKRK